MKKEEQTDQCNCGPEDCPVEGKCQTAGVIYKATVTTSQNLVFKYIGLTEKKFKERWRQHLSNFRTRNRKKHDKIE